MSTLSKDDPRLDYQLVELLGEGYVCVAAAAAILLLVRS